MSKINTWQTYCVECGRASGRISFGGTYAFHFWCWLRWLWRGLTTRAVDFGEVCANCGHLLVNGSCAKCFAPDETLRQSH
jgi:hypothetical protein